MTNAAAKWPQQRCTGILVESDKKSVLINSGFMRSPPIFIDWISGRYKNKSKYWCNSIA